MRRGVQQKSTLFSRRAPRKIGFAATNGQGQRRLRHEAQSALSDETGIFRDAQKCLAALGQSGQSGWRQTTPDKKQVFALELQ
jgi:hypothetical protein